MLRLKVVLRRNLIIGLAVLALAICPAFNINAWTAAEPFPVYPCIQPNVSFWVKIYTCYSTTEGVIHDDRNLNIIYGVIELEPPDLPGSRKVNRRRIKRAKRKYKSILKTLACATSPLGPEEKRIAGLFGPNATSSDFRQAQKNIRCQVGQKDRFRAGLIRSGAYIEEIRHIFSEHGLPEDLAYLPHVESSFNPAAFSRSGAAGIWQFTRTTGKRYLKVNYTVDERRDPILASHAAARLLKKNYTKLQNWPMAITAYNYGINGMLRAWRAKGDYETIFKEHRTRLFKFASRNFYCEFLAARAVAKNYRPYFGELNLARPLESTGVVLGSYASLPQLARRLEIAPETLRRHNPALRKPVFSGQKYVPSGYRLRLPVDHDRDWESLIADLSPEIFKNSQKSSRFYTVGRGDTAGEIASRHRVQLRDLIAANTLDDRATIYVGQVLRIPRPGEEGKNGNELESSAKQKKPESTHAEPATGINIQDAAKAPPGMPFIPPMISALSASDITGPSKLSPEAERPKSEVPAQPAMAKIDRPPEEGNGPGSASTQMIDSCLSKANDLKKRSSPSMISGRLSVEYMMNRQNLPVGVIQVEVEETIGHYAEWLRVRARDIRRLNGLRYGRMIRLGQKIKIPLDQVSAKDFEQKRYEYHKELVEDFCAAYRVDDVRVYSVKRGDNIWELSREEFELPLWLIRRYNQSVDFNALMPSQKLLIPVVEKIG